MFSLRLKHRAARPLAAFAAGALALLGTAACGDDSKGSPDAAVPTDAPEVPTGPAILEAERVFNIDGSRSYYLSLTADPPTATYDRTKAFEINGSADVEVYNGAIYIRKRENNTLSRYHVSNDLKLEKDGEVSFANKGLSAILRYHNAYLTPERAFLLDPVEARLIEWNPTTMKLSTQPDIPIDFIKKAELPGKGVFGVPARVGNRIISPAYWANFDESIMYAGSGAAIVLDATNPTLPAFPEDPRIGGAFRVVGKDNGDMFVVGAVGGDIRKFGSVVGGTMPNSGVLKIPAGATTFDPDYFIDIETITGTQGVANVHVLDDARVLVQVYDPAVAFPATESDYLGSNNFIWKMIDTATKTATDVPELARGGRASGISHIVDGSLYVQYRAPDGNAIVKRIAPDGTIHDAFAVSGGDVWHLQRIR